MRRAPRSGWWWEERGTLAACIVASVLLSAAYSFSARPEFEAAAEIEIDPGGGGLPTPAWWERESHRLRDADFLSRVISRYDLAGSPELAAGPMSTPLKRALRRIQTRGDGPGAEAPAPATAALLSRVAIHAGTKPHRFVLVVRAYDARSAALLANGVARTFVDEISWPEPDTADDPREWIAARLRVPPGGDRAGSTPRAPSIDPRRPSLEADLALARARSARARAEEDEAKARLDALRREAIAGTLDGPELGPIQALQSAQRDLTETDSRRANLEQSLGPRHPDVVAIHERIRRQRADLAAEVARLVQRAEAAADASARVAEAARGSVAAIRAQLSGPRESAPSNAATPTPEAAAGHQSLLAQARPSRATRLPGAERTARLVSGATVPSRPVFPDLTRNLEVATAVGLLMGLLLARLPARLDSSEGAVGK